MRVTYGPALVGPIQTWELLGHMLRGWLDRNHRNCDRNRDRNRDRDRDRDYGRNSERCPSPNLLGYKLRGWLDRRLEVHVEVLTTAGGRADDS